MLQREFNFHGTADAKLPIINNYYLAYISIDNRRPKFVVSFLIPRGHHQACWFDSWNSGFRTQYIGNI